jgi:hypothetical protein
VKSACAAESHDYELYLAVEDIDHSRTKTKSPQTTDVIEKQFLCSAEASRFPVPACHLDGAARRGGQDWPEPTAAGLRPYAYRRPTHPSELRPIFPCVSGYQVFSSSRFSF